MMKEIGMSSSRISVVLYGRGPCPITKSILFSQFCWAFLPGSLRFLGEHPMRVAGPILVIGDLGLVEPRRPRGVELFLGQGPQVQVVLTEEFVPHLDHFSVNSR
jgi:hypothetical protein